MKFVADEMLGRLAKWLRILGCDTLYRTGVSDYELIRIAACEHRVIVTRDRKLGGKTVANRVLWVHSDRYEDQLGEVVAGLGLETRPEMLFSFCLDCNVPVVFVEKECIREAVPEFVYKNHASFHGCPVCGKIYWGGSHYQNAVRKISGFLKKGNIQS
jgi:uncharacterized protein with PIN domain